MKSHTSNQSPLKSCRAKGEDSAKMPYNMAAAQHTGNDICAGPQDFPRPVTDSMMVSSNASLPKFGLLGTFPSWYLMAPSIRHSLDNCYPWSSNIRPDGSVSPPQNLKKLFDASEAKSPRHKAHPSHDQVLSAPSIGTIIAGDYKIQAGIRAEKNFNVYLARALFADHDTFVLTAIRNPQDRNDVAYEEGLKMSSLSKDEIGAKSGDLVSQHLLRTSLDNNKKAAESQRKYIIKLIKKRQISDTYLDTFLYDSLIWIVQRQIPHNASEQPRFHKKRTRQVKSNSVEHTSLDDEVKAKQSPVLSVVDGNIMERSEVEDESEHLKIRKLFSRRLELVTERPELADKLSKLFNKTSGLDSVSLELDVEKLELSNRLRKVWDEMEELQNELSNLNIELSERSREGTKLAREL